MADLGTGHVAAGAQSDLIWVHRLVIAEIPPTVQLAGSGASGMTGVVTKRDGFGRERLGRAGPVSPIADQPSGLVLVFRDPDNIQLELCAPPTT